MADSDMQHSNGEPEAAGRRGGGGETHPLPGSEAARGHQHPEQDEKAAVPTAAKAWRPGEDRTGIRPGSPAAAAIAGTGAADAPTEPDDDGGESGPIPQPAPIDTGPGTGADAPNHGGR